MQPPRQLSSLSSLLSIALKPQVTMFSSFGILVCCLLYADLFLQLLGICSAFLNGKMAGKSTTLNNIPQQKSIIVKIIKIAVLIGLVGASVTFLGVEIRSGFVFSKMMAITPGIPFYSCESFSYLCITSVEILTIKACANLMAAHCVGLVGSLWALNIIKR